MTANKLFNQMLADALGRPIVVSKMAEISGWGAAVAGGLGSNSISLDYFASSVPSKTVEYTPKSDDKVRESEMYKWQQAVTRARGWSSHESKF